MFVEAIVTSFTEFFLNYIHTMCVHTYVFNNKHVLIEKLFECGSLYNLPLHSLFLPSILVLTHLQHGFASALSLHTCFYH